MIILFLILFGLSLGSFVNAWVWRVHQQDNTKSAKTKQKYSIMHGRSMCVHCKHVLAAHDLVPLFSWLSLRGKCRYCKKPISAQYPAVELLTTTLFVASYLFWPENLNGRYNQALLGLWLVQLVCLVALTVYDIRWYLLPNRMVATLAALVGIQILFLLITGQTWEQMLLLVASSAVGGGFFWLLFQISAGKWIGGGDVKLGAVLGLIVGTPGQAFLVLFLASLLGSLAALPLLLVKRLKASSQLPFGPLLIAATVLVKLFGPGLINWYMRLAGL